MNLFRLLNPFVVALALFGLVVSGSAAAPKSAERWEKEIRQFEEKDRAHPPKPGAILFTGSSSIRLWKTLETDFPQRYVLGRGFGGSEMSDLNHYLERIVLPYSPRHILVYEGDNDLASGKSPEQVLTDFQTFVSRVRARLPRVRIDYIAVKPSKARWHLFDRIKTTNESIAQWAKTQSRVGYIDVFTPMLRSSGELRIELFQSDGLHLNADGYALWTQIIRRRI
ncbi:MAG: hypothetical protein JNN07_20385 [Verrucomicrobiales bacterium]|nr:hypothetical protein [Verrucomicrobiales bacterium]